MQPACSSPCRRRAQPQMEPRPCCPPWREDPRRKFSGRGRPLEEDPRRELLETEMNLPVTFWMSRAGRDRVVEAAQQTSRRRVKIILELELLTLSWTILIMTNLFCWPLYIPTSLPLSSPSTRHLHHPIRGWLVRIRTFQSEESSAGVSVWNLNVGLHSRDQLHLQWTVYI